MPIVSGFVVPKMNPTSHDGNIRLLRPMVLTIKHQIDNQTKNDETNGKEKTDEILGHLHKPVFRFPSTYLRVRWSGRNASIP